MLSATKSVKADQSPLVTPIFSIFVYTDFIEYVMVGNTKRRCVATCQFRALGKTRRIGTSTLHITSV